MDKFEIKTHTFEDAKNEIESFSKKTASSVILDQVDSDGMIPIFDHLVTGKELNRLNTQTQEYLIRFNELNIEFIKMFGKVYTAFDSLDKDYIQAILIALKAAEKAAKEAQDAQKDINKTIAVQEQTINVLKQFDEKLAGYEHLDKIDEMWWDFKNFKKEFEFVKYKVEYLSNQLGLETDTATYAHIDHTEAEEKNANLVDGSVLKRNVRIAYILAGSAVGVSVLQIILNLFGII